MNDPLCHPTIRLSKVWMLQGGGVTVWELTSRKLGGKCRDELLGNPPPRSFSGNQSYSPNLIVLKHHWFFSMLPSLLQWLNSMNCKSYQQTSTSTTSLSPWPVPSSGPAQEHQMIWSPRKQHGDMKVVEMKLHVYVTVSWHIIILWMDYEFKKSALSFLILFWVFWKAWISFCRISFSSKSKWLHFNPR